MQFAYRGPNRRTVAEIQRKVVKRSKRNVISRLFYAKNDQGAITAWRLDLNRILHIFNVRSLTIIWALLIDCFQTELAIITNVVVSDIHRDVATAQTVVSGVHRGVSDIHRTMVEDRGGTNGENWTVSFAHTLFMIECD